MSSTQSPDAAEMQVCTRLPSSCSCPVRRSRTWPSSRGTTHDWQIPIRQPKGIWIPAPSPASINDVAASAVTVRPLRPKVDPGESGLTFRPDLDDAVVRLAEPVSMDQVIAAYVDTAAAEEAVEKAIEAIDAADLGDEDADLIVGDAQDHDLAWYANQELPFLLDLW